MQKKKKKKKKKKRERERERGRKKGKERLLNLVERVEFTESKGLIKSYRLDFATSRI